MSNFLKKIPKDTDGILSYNINDTVTNKVVEFYKETPFPNYKDDDDKYSILNKGNANFLASQFKINWI